MLAALDKNPFVVMGSEYRDIDCERVWRVELERRLKRTKAQSTGQAAAAQKINMLNSSCTDATARCTWRMVSICCLYKPICGQGMGVLTLSAKAQPACVDNVATLISSSATSLPKVEADCACCCLQAGPAMLLWRRLWSM
jgi:hypothetical protein